MTFDRTQNRSIYPFASHWHTTASGAKMHYLDEGHGDNVVLCLHGNPTWSFYFRRVALELSDVARIIVPDHIGCGLSDKPSDDAYRYTLLSRVQDVESLLKELNITANVTLLLHDWGGMIGMAVAHRHPELVKNIVLLNTGAFPLPKTKPLPWQLRLARTPLGTLLIRGLNVFATGTANLGTVKPINPQVRAGLIAPYDSWKNRIATLRFVQDIPLSSGDCAWSVVKETATHLTQWRNTPVLIFWGQQDPVFDSHFLKQWRNYLPNAIVREYPDAGHYVLEEKADEIIAGIRELI
ncbi:MAG: alpha/beta fold hydrolase [Candidatus Sumerlaeales bacterium]|nr:alpha/beta fold hydrolase [Candidatus Sumerlaeales bacterium]